MPPTNQVKTSVAAAAAEVPTDATSFLVVEDPRVYLQANHGGIQQAPELSQSATNENCSSGELLSEPAKVMPYDTIGGYSSPSNNNAAQRSLSIFLEDSSRGGLPPASNLLSLDCSRMPSKCGSLAQLDAETQDLELLSLGVSLNSPIAAAQQQRK